MVQTRLGYKLESHERDWFDTWHMYVLEECGLAQTPGQMMIIFMKKRERKRRLAKNAQWWLHAYLIKLWASWLEYIRPCLGTHTLWMTTHPDLGVIPTRSGFVQPTHRYYYIQGLESWNNDPLKTTCQMNGWTFFLDDCLEAIVLQHVDQSNNYARGLGSGKEKKKNLSLSISGHKEATEKGKFCCM